MEAEDIKKYVESLERRIEILGNEKAALTVTLNKLMMENMRLKAELKTLGKKVSSYESRFEVKIPGEEDQTPSQPP